MFANENLLKSRVDDILGSGVLGGKRRKAKGAGVVSKSSEYEGGGPIGDTFGVPQGVFNWFGLGKKKRKSKGGAGMNPMSLMNPMNLFNPMGAMAGMMTGSGVVKKKSNYEGAGVVNKSSEYAGGGLGDSMGVPRFLNWFGIGKKPKRKRGPSARGAKISQLMKSKGLTLGEASRYLKEHGG